MTPAELITELQAARPIADGALRYRVGAIADESRGRSTAFARLSRSTRRRRFVLVALPATAVVLLGVAGVAGLVDSTTPPQSVAVREDLGRLQAATPSTDRAAPAAKAAGSSAGAITSGATTSPTPAPTSGRAQRFSAQLMLSVKNVDALSNATQQALRITRDLGGYLVTASYATSDTGTSSLTLKVPTANVQDAIVRLSGLGEIVSQQVQIDDLQGQVDELAKREKALREQIARLRARLASPELDAETRATLEARREAARSELAQVRVARAQVNAEARFATIQLGLQTRQSSVAPAVPSRFDRGVDRAVEILGMEAMVALYTLVLVGPLALILLAAWLVRRGLRRREDERLLSAS